MCEYVPIGADSPVSQPVRVVLYTTEACKEPRELRDESGAYEGGSIALSTSFTISPGATAKSQLGRISSSDPFWSGMSYLCTCVPSHFRRVETASGSTYTTCTSSPSLTSRLWPCPPCYHASNTRTMQCPSLIGLARAIARSHLLPGSQLSVAAQDLMYGWYLKHSLDFTSAKDVKKCPLDIGS